MSQEVCTSNLCYLYNKPYEDERVHLQNIDFTNNATEKDLGNISWKTKTSIASYFGGIDDIFMSINNVKKDLITMGFEDPVICLISA